jgi:site-specific recombinase XerD
LIENGVDTRVVQILLDDASIATTAIYTDLTTPTRASPPTRASRTSYSIG